MGCRKLAYWSEEKPVLRCVRESGEHQKSCVNWYDYGARFYDPSLGRWHVPDPLCEYHYNLTPNHYVMNNPLRYIDPFGLDTLDEVTVYAEKWNNRGGINFMWIGMGQNQETERSNSTETVDITDLMPGVGISPTFYTLRMLRALIDIFSKIIKLFNPEPTPDADIKKKSTGSAKETNRSGRPIIDEQTGNETESDSMVIEVTHIFYGPDPVDSSLVQLKKIDKTSRHGRFIGKKHYVKHHRIQ